jgi:hypothetical protein
MVRMFGILIDGSLVLDKAKAADLILRQYIKFRLKSSPNHQHDYVITQVLSDEDPLR